MSFREGVDHHSEVGDPRIQTFPWCSSDATSIKRIHRRRRIYVLNNVIGSTRYGVNQDSLESLKCCLTGRLYKMYKNNVYYDPLPYQGNKHFELAFVKLARIKGSDSSRKSLLETVNSYTGRKRTLYSKAMESLKHSPLVEKDSHSKFFQKFEKIDTTKIPRCIQPRSTRYHLELASFLKHEEHQVYGALHTMFGHDVVAKGKNVEQTAAMFEQAFENFREPVAVGLDASKFDMHVRKEVLQLEHSVYLNMYKHDPDHRMLKQLLEWQLDNKGTAKTYDGILKFSVNGSRFSGDINTSLGNVIIMCLLIYAFFSQQQFKNYRLIDNGDDAVVVMEKADLHRMGRFQSYANTIGFRIEIEEPVSVLEHVRFCQMAPIYCPNQYSQYTMVRDPENLFQKDIMSTHDLRSLSIRRKWMYAVGEGGLSMYGNVPCLRDFYYSYVRQGDPCSKMKNDREIMNMAAHYWGRGMHKKYSNILDRTRLSYYEAFNVPPHEQLLFESKCASADWLNLSIDTIAMLPQL